MKLCLLLPIFELTEPTYIRPNFKLLNNQNSQFKGTGCSTEGQGNKGDELTIRKKKQLKNFGEYLPFAFALDLNADLDR